MINFVSPAQYTVCTNILLGKRPRVSIVSFLSFECFNCFNSMLRMFQLFRFYGEVQSGIGLVVEKGGRREGEEKSGNSFRTTARAKKRAKLHRSATR